MNDKIINNNSFLRILSSVVLISIALFGLFINDKFLIFSLCVIVFLATYEWVVITEDLNTQILKYTKSIQIYGWIVILFDYKPCSSSASCPPGVFIFQK